MSAIDKLYSIAKKNEARIEELEYALRLAMEIMPRLWHADSPKTPKVSEGDYRFVAAELQRVMNNRRHVDD